MTARGLNKGWSIRKNLTSWISIVLGIGCRFISSKACHSTLNIQDKLSWSNRRWWKTWGLSKDIYGIGSLINHIRTWNSIWSQCWRKSNESWKRCTWWELWPVSIGWACSHIVSPLCKGKNKSTWKQLVCFRRYGTWCQS